MSLRRTGKMPIYEYECEKCGAIEEALQMFSDQPRTKCKKCSGHLHKLISQSTFHLKGTGWYVTDYAGKSQGNTPSSKKQEKTQSESPAPKKDSAE
jgi:putative FmdB family regulatory protein